MIKEICKWAIFQGLFCPGRPKPWEPSAHPALYTASIHSVYVYSFLFFNLCLNLLLCTMNNLYWYTGGAVGRFFFGPYKAPASNSQAPARPQPSIWQNKYTNGAPFGLFSAQALKSPRGPWPFLLFTSNAFSSTDVLGDLKGVANKLSIDQFNRWFVSFLLRWMMCCVHVVLPEQNSCQRCCVWEYFKTKL